MNTMADLLSKYKAKIKYKSKIKQYKNINKYIKQNP